MLNAIGDRDIGHAPLHHLVVVDTTPKLREPVNGRRLGVCGVGVFAHRSATATAWTTATRVMCLRFNPAKKFMDVPPRTAQTIARMRKRPNMDGFTVKSDGYEALAVQEPEESGLKKTTEDV
jgi:hypothetical protein